MSEEDGLSERLDCLEEKLDRLLEMVERIMEQSSNRSGIGSPKMVGTNRVR